MINYLNNTYRLPDNSIRPGETPSDGLMVTRKVKKDDTKVGVPFKPGSKVAYQVYTVTDVDEDGNISIPKASGDGYVVVLGKAFYLTDGGDAL